MIPLRSSARAGRRPPRAWAGVTLVLSLAIFGPLTGHAQAPQAPGVTGSNPPGVGRPQGSGTPVPKEPHAPTALAEQPEAPPATGITLGDLLDKSAYEREQRVARVVEEALSAKDKAGTWRRLENKSIVRLGAADAALSGLKKNLSIEVSQHEAERVRRAIIEAEAVFDPVLDLSVAYDERDTHQRTIVGTVKRQVFQPGTLLPPPANESEVEVDLSGLPDEARNAIKNTLGAPLQKIIFAATPRTQNVPTTIFASRDSPNGPTRTGTYTMALTQQLPWGPSFNVSVITSDRDVFYDSQGHSFGAPWASELLFNLEVPLPGGRNFGPYSVFDTDIKLAHKSSERGFWALKSTINTTLLNIDLAYLDLVQRLEELLVRIENRQLVERQGKHTGRLFDRGFATVYDKAQIEAELAQAQATEEAARNRYIAASDILATLIEYSAKAVRDNVYLPAGYPAWLEKPLQFDAGSLLTTALQSRPELQVSRVDHEASQIVKENATVETRPDVTLNASIGSSQNGSSFGYKSWEESIGAIRSPDTLTQSYGASYRYPWGNRTFKARLAQAEGGVQDSALVQRSTHNDVVKEVNDALSNVRSARGRIARAEQNLEAARAAYNSIARRAETGGSVNENELIIDIRNLLQAKLAKIAATIENKRAESSLLAAQGLIAQHYAGMTAGNPLERHRLNVLSEKGNLEYFLR